ncbi:MAG: DNA-3-methyladenine glycosylase I [Phycisphaeraceae bacterium]
MATRCPWADGDERMELYHDREWGVPSHDDRHLFEMLVLDGAQAGLSWRTILHKRDGYREAFAAFDPERVAEFTSRDVERLVANPAIVRNRRKIEASIQNARALLETREAAGSFDAYIWQFVDGQPQVNNWQARDQVPARSAASEAMSRDLRKRGFQFVGPTICYAFMQAAGMVNDHLVDCPRHEAIARHSHRAREDIRQT